MNPRRDSVVFFEDRLRNHSKVEEIEKISDYYYLIKRRQDHKNIKLLITDFYTIGMADFIEQKNLYPDMNAMLTISSWNGYTQSVKEEAKKEQIGIFVFAELLGAINFNEFWNYTKRDNEGKPIFFGGRSG